MTRTVTVGEAKTHFSRLVRRAEKGEEIVVRRGSEPVARIVPLAKNRGGVTGRGSMKGKIRLSPDFDEADAEIQRMFEESEIFPAEDSSPDRD
jgi:prevent-host-death family protein